MELSRNNLEDIHKVQASAENRKLNHYRLTLLLPWRLL